MAYQAIFKRYELKFRLNAAQKAAVLAAIEPYMVMDRYGRTLIRNLYFDTPDFRLIRRSMEKPVYKEKLRVRCYGDFRSGEQVFVELKKKYKKVVYKRRISLPEGEAMDWLCGRSAVRRSDQISREIDYFLSYYGQLRPAVFLSYEREAFYCRDGGDFRVTFDENIRCRRQELSLAVEGGEAVSAPGEIIMELKCSGGLPLWMTRVLSSLGVYKTSFSKYGTAYGNIIFPKENKQYGTIVSRNF